MTANVSPDLTTQNDPMDFAALLEESFSKGLPERGDIVEGTILAIDHQGLLVDIGLKNDGIVPRTDLERLDQPVEFEVGQRIYVMVIRMEDQDGNLVVSISQARQAEDWTRAERLMQDGTVWEGEVIEANRGGLIIPFGNLRGFVPASHVVDLPRGVSETERKDFMMSHITQPISVKIIEVNRKRRRLVLSQRDAVQEQRTSLKEKLLSELKEGEAREGIISGLRDFGAFVDLGGADGLIHISELAWHRIRHPREVVNIGDKVKVYILSLDREGKRIGLSLKRLQENPWAKIEEQYHIGQLVIGRVSRVAQFGAFVNLEPGIEALLHNSQISNPPPQNAENLFFVGQQLLLRIISIESDRQRLGLSLKEVTDGERMRWAEEHGLNADELSIIEVNEKEMPMDNDADAGDKAHPTKQLNVTEESPKPQVESRQELNDNNPVEAAATAG